MLSPSNAVAAVKARNATGQKYGAGGNASVRNNDNSKSGPVISSRENLRYRNLVNKRSQIENKHFSLPKINTISDREMEAYAKKGSSSEFQQARKSQVVGHELNEEAMRLYSGVGASKESIPQKKGGLNAMMTSGTALLAKQPQQQRKGMTLQHSANVIHTFDNQKVQQPSLKDAIRNLHMPNTTKGVNANKSSAHNFSPDIRHNQLTTKSKYQQSIRPGASTSNMSLNKKMRQAGGGIGVKSVEVDDIPSDISADEWGEIQKFGQKLHEEQLKKAKYDH